MSNDRIVTAKLILQAQLERQRLGHRRVLSLLESQEPDLIEYVLESLTAQFHKLLDAGVASKDARRLHHAAEAVTLTSILALRNAHAALWQEQTGQELQARLDPAPSDPPASPS